jgi:bromodomain-containing factor 1
LQENDSGELELDIDQLSNDCLLKLWDLCKKALPGFGKGLPAPASSPAVNSGSAAKQASSKSGKPKKNKPMSAREQEDRIARLSRLRDLYTEGKGGQEPTMPLPTQEAQVSGDSSEDSDSEEE